MLGYLSADITCSEKNWERCSKKTESFEEQIVPKDKYPSIFSRQMEAIVFIILQIFFVTRAVLEMEEYWSPEYSSVLARAYIQTCETLRPIACERKYLMDYKCIYFSTKAVQKQMIRKE